MATMTATEARTKARLTPGRQWVGIRHIDLDERFQPRAKVDLDWASELSAFRKEGSTFPPPRIYQLPDGRLVPASGFHRITSLMRDGEDQVLCDVVDGTEEDAIVHAAGSNKGNGVKPMGPKDITKAVEMLLEIDAWWNKANQPIADHVGCSAKKVIHIRSRIAAQTGRPLPDTVADRNGRESSYRRSAKNGHRPAHRCSNNGHVYYRGKYKGKVYNGKTAEIVNRKIEEAIAKNAEKYSPQGIRSVLSYRGFVGVFQESRSFRGLGGAYWRPGIVTMFCDFGSPESLPLVVGRLIAAHEYKGDPAARMVVLCYPEGGPDKAIDLFRRRGFEFLTPEELAESLKGGVEI